MYTVACSSCNHVEKSPFARVGAVMVCPACKAKVQLRVEDVKRQFKLRVDADDELFRVPQVQHVPEDAAVGAAAALAVALESSPTPQPLPELEIHEDHSELAAEAQRRAEEARKRKVKPQVVSKPGLSSGELAQHLAQKRSSKTLAIAGGVGLAAVIGIIIVLSSGPSSEKDGPTTKDGTVVITDPPKDGATDPSKDKTQLPGSDGEKDKTLPSKDGGSVVKPPDPNKDKAVVVPPKPVMVRVPAVPLGIDTWQQVNEAYNGSSPSSKVLLINDSSQKQDNGGQLFKGEVVSQGVSSALVTISLVNDEDRVYARFERPYFLLDGKNGRPIQLSIPPELVGSATSVCWSIAPIDTHVSNPTLLEDTLAEVVKPDASPLVKISAYNASSYQLKDAAFVIQGVDAAGQIVSQWRLKYPELVDARSWVKFEAQLPATDVKKYASWRVLGAGLAEGAAVAPPPVVAPETDPNERDPRQAPPPRRGKGLFDF